MISGLVSRPWCLMEICSRQEIINIVTDPSTETTKIGLLICITVNMHHAIHSTCLSSRYYCFIFFAVYYFNTNWNISGMEARYNCCMRIYKSLTQSSRVSADPAFAGIAAKVRCQTFSLCIACVCISFIS